ncbi:glycosyltransferase [Halovulum dunhuangense]|uniref:Glycosyltransferase n=1 Tax=Halovulum dunhuangense TaxID=1505036 RepID=A0A849KYW6_9RHOB|nr:glycosyltransferase [Halovulum dunhuangense]NNU79012.1 glycosyltransferase [Halovulum dunhuangense]
MTPRIAIVIPVHGHAALASESIASALALDGTVVIAVDDGCPLAETRATLEGWALTHPGRFHRVTQVNRGLSGARNTGIDLALDRYPGLEAVFLLDADNRLDPHAAALFEHLLGTRPDADWFYPNFDMIGLAEHAHNGGDFSVALLAESNFSEAGSLIRRRVFDAGIRFDESMRKGYEDWEFFLSAARAGFRGAPVRQAFFRYRKRPESMLSGSHDQDTVLRADIRARHRWLYDGDAVAQRAAGHTPRYRLIETDAPGRLLAFTDPEAPVTQGLDDAIRELRAARARPTQNWRPMAWILARPGLLAMLADRRLARSAVWHLHRALGAADLAAARLIRHPGEQWQIDMLPPAQTPDTALAGTAATPRTRALAEAEFRVAREAEREALEDADLLMIGAEGLDALAFPKARKAPRAVRQAADALSEMRVARLTIALDRAPASREGAAPLDGLRDLATTIRDHPQEDRAYLAQLAPWRTDPAVSSPRDIDWVLRNHTLGGVPLPRNAQGHGRDIGFVMPIFQFGGVEKCVVALASALGAQGARCHLFVHGDGSMVGTDWLTAPFETIHMLSDPLLRSWKGRQYLGTNLATPLDPDLLSAVLAPLTGMDAVVATGTAALFHGLSALRGKGIVTVSYEHLTETGGYGRTYGTPYLATAYEGGLDLVLTCSNRLADWLHGQGIPRAKLLAIPNGPGFPMTEAEVRAVRNARASRDPRAPLRVGFLGRLDGQKGADRFVALANRLKDWPVEFSITGGAILGGGDIAVPDHVRRYPAAYDIADLTQAFARLDVLLMPSRDEGLPLTIMEAQRAGVIPVATDVGAVSEGIADGVNGFLIREGDVVEGMESVLARLLAEPDLRHRLSVGGPVTDRQWDANAAALMAALEPILARRRAA